MVVHMEGKEQSILRVFIGSYQHLPKVVVLTPISEIYEQICNVNRVLYTTAGWWRSARCRSDKGEFLLVKIPQGPAIIDLVVVTSQLSVKTIVFLGYCGCLEDDFQIGDCIFSIGVWGDGEFVPCPDPNLNVGVKGISAHCLSLLLEDERFLADLRTKNVSAVDMETYYLYKYAQLMRTTAYSLLIVSDFPGSLPFYELSSNDLRQLENGVCATVAQLGEIVAYAEQNQSQSCTGVN